MWVVHEALRLRGEPREIWVFELGLNETPPAGSELFETRSEAEVVAAMRRA